MQIGPYSMTSQALLAPMAGITDRPFRELCKQFGAGLAVSEMLASNPALRHHHKTLLKANHEDEPGLVSIQLVGTHPRQLADAAAYNEQRGAKIIDINMGCPAKKVCSVAAGSALLKDESLVKHILDAVIGAVSVPVTLKIRTGWDHNHKNAVEIAKIAEHAGVSALTVHGRTRACKFNGHAEYETIKAVKQAVTIPVIANGDIDSPEKAKWVLDETGADAIMIGRAAQGNPWLFTQINEFLSFGTTTDKPKIQAVRQVMLSHVESLYSFYGNAMGVRIARKHIGWYFNRMKNIGQQTRDEINKADEPLRQLAMIKSAFITISNDQAAYGSH